ncbi:amino acid ABC transporter permease [Rhodopila sp.]|jgi:polar amino acid transport system permease protein|uniref:amino acid ABC transporter permease n=1 Tax=Rhodopila sp. TaxID=2480087 RepID=UPI002BD60305|nr:amino acid ABC transporter permease [Rhodopila sp.]HVZ08431.1 amino acid ABC transporter permease [Rhodopila sp.]
MAIDLNFLARLLPDLLQGALVTVELSVLTMLICLVWGLLVALAHMTRGPLGWLAGAYIQIVRNTPLLIQMYIVYFGFPMAGFAFSGFTSGLLALCLQNGGYVAEIYRGGLQSVSARQYEAGRALGMRRWTLYRVVILPQVIARVVPPLANQAISITKDTAQVAAIAVMDIMKVAQVWVESSANTYDVFFAVALIYLVLTTIISLGARIAERQLAFAS